MYFSGSSNNYKSKIKSKKVTSTTPNTKINPNQGKIRKLHRTPINTLNKSQNISITKKLYEPSDKKVLKNFNHIQINLKKILPMHNLKNMNFRYKTKNLKLKPLLYNNNNNRINTKTNSLSNYFGKTVHKINHNLRKNHSNTNIINITNTNTTNFNGYIKNNYYYQTKPNNFKKNSLIKIRDILNNEDLTIYKNMNKNSSFYPLVITEESKKNLNEKKEKIRIKKSESSINIYSKNQYPSIKTLKACSTQLFIKPDLILNNNYSSNQDKKENINPIIIKNQTENNSSGKNSGNAHIDSFENKIINEIKEFKNYKNNEIMDKIKVIFNEVIEYLVPKESKNIFSMLIKEIYNINKDYIDNLKHSEEIIEKYKMKIFQYEKKYRELGNIIKNKEKEINTYKIELEKIKKESKIFTNLKMHKIYQNFDIKLHKNNVSSKELKIQSDNNSFIKKLNAKNVDDLDALYFMDKINYIQNDVEQIPKLNLEPKYIEKCMKKELIKRNEVKMTPFQKIAMQFEMPDSLI